MSIGRIVKLVVMATVMFAVGGFIVSRIPPLRAYVFGS